MCLPISLSIQRQFTAALADLHEAAKLCPNNREIRRLLARVEEECKQMQRTQTKGGLSGAAAASSQASGGHESDQEQDEGQEDASEHNLSRSVKGQRDALEEEEEDEEEAPRHDRTAEACWSQNSFSYNRGPFESVCNSMGHQSQTPNSPPGPSRLPSHQYPREHWEALSQQGLVLQPTKQAQIVKTNQHMSSMQAGGGAVGGRTGGPKAQYAPSSPLPSRHMSSMLKPGPGIDISPLPPPADEPVYGNRMPLAAASTSMGHACENENLHSPQTSFTSCSTSSMSLGPERLSPHSASSLDGLACSGPGPQGNHTDPGKEGMCGAVGSQGGANSSMRVSSSTSSLASSSSLSDSGKLGPDVRTKTKHSQQSSSAAEYKPRPFMGITDRTARFQQQVQQHQQHHSLQSHQSLQSAGRSWLNHSSDGLVCHNVSAVGPQPVDSELPYAKTVSTYQDQHKPPPPPGAMAMSSLQNGMHAKEFAEKFCQATNCYKESKPALAMQHSFMDSKPKQTGLARENPAIHVAAMKPKRSFIESNV